MKRARSSRSSISQQCPKSPIVICGLPGFVRIVEFHPLNDVERIASQIFLVDDSIVINHECLYACDAIVGRYGDKHLAGARAHRFFVPKSIG
jgi:hypothetical protein